MTQRIHSTRTDDRGAVVILVALSMVGIMIMAAIVLDLGQMRSTRRTDHAAADLAALAAGAYLSGNAGSTDQMIADPRGACEAAFNSIKANLDDFPAAATINCSSLPATGSAPDCTETMGIQPVTASGAAPYQLTIEYPVPPGEIEENRFDGGVGANDGELRCQRMRVNLTRTNEPFFAGVIGVESLEVNVSSTVRAANGQVERGTAALLLLERVGCPAIDANAPSGGGIQVLPSNDTNPGVIQVDSAGVVGADMCTANDNAEGWVAYGRELSSSPGGPSIVALPAPSGEPGVIGLRSLGVGGRGASPVPEGVSPEPGPSQIMSRGPVDEKYNGEASEGGFAQISNLHADGYYYATKSPVLAAAVGFTVIGCDAPPMVPESKIYVNCGDFAARPIGEGGTRFPNASEVVFNGKVSIGSNSRLSIPNADTIYVRGCAGNSCSNLNSGGTYAIRVSGNGELWVNTGGDGSIGNTCTNLASRTNATTLATFGGPLKISGHVTMCHTFVYLGEDLPTHVRRTHTQNYVSTTYSYPTVAACTPEKPCPAVEGEDETGNGAVLLSGGDPRVDWSAPNQLNVQPEDSDWAANPFEDLALWTESIETSEIKGQGASTTTGVFFAPNATVNFSGQAVQSQPINAQFVARRFLMSGQGTLSLKPNPADAVQTPIPGGWSLIR